MPAPFTVFQMSEGVRRWYLTFMAACSSPIEHHLENHNGREQPLEGTALEALPLLTFQIDAAHRCCSQQLKKTR